jgi:UDP-N-acetylmuramoyl-L-alanyl-D-glutamate--2,6-diaminopimelate ligase
MRQIQRSSRVLRLRELFPQTALFLGDDVACSGSTSRASCVEPGDLFVGLDDPDLHEQVRRAIARGAVAIACERVLPIDVPQVIVDDAREALGRCCHALAGEPSKRLPVVGVAGTLGKTTTALLIASVLNQSRRGVASFTSLAHCDSVEATPSDDATPEAEELAQHLAAAAEHGCSHAVVELSSHALAERRAAGLELETAVLTNIRRAHLERHGSATNYRAAVERMFGLLRPGGVAVLNADDSVSQSILERLDRPALTYSLHGYADVTASLLERSVAEQTFYLQAGSESIPVCTRMIGDHHLYNCLAAAAVGLLQGLSLATIARGLEAVERLPGRMERLECGQEFSLFVDEAAGHDALAMCLKTARQVTGGRVICVASTSSERDAAERPLIGRVLEKLADVSVVANENGQGKSLAAAHDVLDGFQRPGKAHVIPSRQKAIRWAIESAQPGDCVLICGNGHRTWRAGRRATDDASLARTELYRLVAESNRTKPFILAFSG